MKKLFSLFAAVLFAGSMMADSYSFTFVKGDLTTSTTKFESGDVTWTLSNPTSGWNGTAGQLGYIFGSKNNPVNLSVSTSDIKGTITAVSVVGRSNNKDKSVSVAVKVGSSDFTGATTTWDNGNNQTLSFTGSASGELVVTLTPEAGIVLAGISVEYTPGEGGDPEPVQKYYLVGSALGWEAKDANELKANPNQSGEYMLALTVAAGDGLKVLGVKGETQTWYKDGMGNEYVVSDEEAGEVTVYFRPEGNEGWVYTYFTLVPKAPVAKKTCADVYELEKDAEVALNDVVVTYVNGINVYVKDATGSLLIYLPKNTTVTWKAGDVLAGVEGVLDIYNGLYEVKPTADQVAAIVATAGEAPEPEVLETITADDMNKLVVLKDVSVEGEFTTASATNLDATVGEVTFQLRNNFMLAQKFRAGKRYNITGVGGVYTKNGNTTVQLYFISAEVNQATAVENTAVAPKAQKVLRDGQIYIIRDGVMFNANGAAVK